MLGMSWLCTDSSRMRNVALARRIILLACLILAPAVMMTGQGKGSAARRKVSPASDGQQAYQNKCMSCHRETHKYSEGKQATILRHMRVRGDLTEKETQDRSEGHTSELQSPCNLVCRLLLEKKKKK